jgi:periplasmic divalent cation tolerance protein
VDARPTGCCQISTTLPTRAAANNMGEVLVTERLAACAQVLGPISSTYRWKGVVEHAEEWYCFIKTTESRIAEVGARIRELHPYEVPEVIATSITGGDEQYLRWIREMVAER